MIGQPTARDKVFTPGPGRVFVFGSNLAGMHGAGAARTALDLYGARMGQGRGLQGSSYAIPTKGRQLETLPLEDIGDYVEAFLTHAAANPDLSYFVTRIGCGLAGLVDQEVAPLFRGAPSNVELPDGWRELAEARPWEIPNDSDSAHWSEA